MVDKLIARCRDKSTCVDLYYNIICYYIIITYYIMYMDYGVKTRYKLDQLLIGYYFQSKRSMP